MRGNRPAAISLFGAMAMTALVISGCGGRSVPSGETRHETTSIDLDKIESARVNLEMGGGELHVKSGTSKLVEANFAFSIPDWAPKADYHANGSRGELTISQPKNSSSSFRNSVYTWDVTLNDQVPLELGANVGGGEANLEIGRMNLSSVEVNMGAGELKIDLRGEPKHGYDVRIQGGVGQATIYLPKDAGISATAVGGIGNIAVDGLEKRNGVWVNPERIGAPATIQLDVKGGVGEIHLIR